MATYQYVAKERSGQTVSGMLEAGTESEAAELLHNKSLIVISIKLSKRKVTAVGGEKKLKLDDLVVFSRQLATLIDAGIPLVQSLGILGEQIEKKDFRNIIVSVRQDIEAGMSFCDALAKHPKIFSDFFVNMAKAGEASGMLDEVLDRLSSYMENIASLNRKIRASLVYPAIVLSMALIITIFLLVKVVPTFKGIFDMLGGQLPLPTLILLGISNFVKRYFLFAAGAGFVLSFLFNRYINSDKGRYNFDSFKLRMFVLGTLFRKVAVAKFARSFSTLVRSGVAVLNALDIVAKTSGNKVVERAVMDCRDAVRNGEPINKTLSKSGVFPPMVCRMIGVGEQTGQLEKMLTKIADFYEDQVNAAVSGLTSMIEPLVIAFLGVVIGAIVIALFLPIFKITQLVSG
jgi:type IV pilus assembly protein PilC